MQRNPFIAALIGIIVLIVAVIAAIGAGSVPTGPAASSNPTQTLSPSPTP